MKYLLRSYINYVNIYKLNGNIWTTIYCNNTHFLTEFANHDIKNLLTLGSCRYITELELEDFLLEKL